MNQKRQISLEPNQEKEQKSRVLAVALTSTGFFIPFLLGTGQYYKGDKKKGILLSIGQTVNFLLLFVIIGWITYPLLGIIALWDAMTK